MSVEGRCNKMSTDFDDKLLLMLLYYNEFKIVMFSISKSKKRILYLPLIKLEFENLRVS